MDLNNSWVVITGASRGIGVTIAEEFAKRKANLILVARSMDRLEKVCAGLEKFGTTTRPISFDLQNIGQIEKLVRKIYEITPHVDILVNNAGLEKYCFFSEYHTADITSILSVNLIAPMELTRLLLPRMLDRKKGHIVNISSLGGKVGEVFNSIYSASKGGIDLWTDALQHELYGTGVNVSLVNPGYVTDSGMIHNIGLGTAFISGNCKAKNVSAAVIKCISKRKNQVFVNSIPVRPIIIFKLLFPRLFGLLIRWGGVMKLNLAKVEKRKKIDQAASGRRHDVKG